MSMSWMMPRADVMRIYGMQPRHWMPAAACPRDSGGGHHDQEVMPAQGRIQEPYMPLQAALDKAEEDTCRYCTTDQCEALTFPVNLPIDDAVAPSARPGFPVHYLGMVRVAPGADLFPYNCMSASNRACRGEYRDRRGHLSPGAVLENFTV